MFGPNKKTMARKRAMDSMIKEGPALKFKSRKESLVEEMGEDSQRETGDQEKEGYVSLLVSPEEKAMIMKMRGESEDDGEEIKKEDYSEMSGMEA